MAATNYTIKVTDRLLRFDTTANDVVVTMLPFAQTPNAPYEIHRTSTGDGHTVTIEVNGAPDFLLPDGSTALTLDDNAYAVYIKIPDNGQSPAYVAWGSGGGGFTPPSASPPVSNLSASVIVRSNQIDEVVITYDVDASATLFNFAGVEVYLEDPDISSLPTMTLDGSSTLDGQTTQVAGNWSPLLENKNHSTWSATGAEQHDPADILVSQPKQGASYGLTRNIRVYLASYGPYTSPHLIRANQPNATPSIVIPMPAPSESYERGEEYAWLITHPGVALEEEFDRPDPQYRMLYTYTPPNPGIPVPPGMKPFGGVEIKFAKPDSQNLDPVFEIDDTGVFVPVANADGYLSPVYNPVSLSGKFRVYFCSGDNGQPAQVNSLIPGVTPYVEINVVYPPATNAAGQPVTPDVIGLKLSNPRFVWQPDNSIWAEADLTWTPPQQANYGGVSFYRTAVNGVWVEPPVWLADAGNVDTATTLKVVNWPHDVAQNWTITAISFDTNNKMNNDPESPRTGSPQVTWTIGGPPTLGSTGEEFANLVTPPSSLPVVEQQVSNDGLQMMRFTFTGWKPPTETQDSTKFGGMQIEMVDNNNTVSNPVIWDAGTNTTFTTPWMPAVTEQDLRFYYVSYNGQGKANTILPMLTPSQKIHFVPSPGAIKASQIPNSWWNTAEFSWPNWPADGGFQANVIQAGKIAVGSILRVGGAPSGSPFAPSFAGQNGQVAVYSSGFDTGDNGTPTLRAWMGQQSTVLPGPGNRVATVYGGWFGELYVGGAGPPTSPIYVQNGGIVIVGGWDVQTVNNQTYYPYISIRDRTNVEVGRMGAHIATTPSGNIVPPGDIADIGGAWFKEFATGGSNLSDWRLLCPGDNTLRLRNISRFEIDYPANVYPAPPYNAPYQLLLGTDQAFQTLGTTQNKFPGITLFRVDPSSGNPTTHGMTLINRGLILTDAAPPIGTISQTQRVALITFNGDQAGGDGEPFWGVLAMYSPKTGIQNVAIASGSIDTGGALNGAPYINVWDGTGANNINFQVRQTGDVVIRGQLMQGLAATPVMDSSGAWIGPVKTSFMTLGSLNIAGAAQNPVIDTGGNFVGPTVNITGTIKTTSTVTGNQGFYVGAQQVIDNTGKWVGPAITTVGQTPWAQNINAQGYSLGQNLAGWGVGAIYSYNQRFWLIDQASGSTPTIGIFGGNGLIISGPSNTNPAMNFQQQTIDMSNVSGYNVCHIQTNYADSNYPGVGVMFMGLKDPFGSQTIVFFPAFGDQVYPPNPSRGSGRFPVIGMGSGSTPGGFVQLWNNRVHGFTTGSANCFMLDNGVNGTAGALRLYNNGLSQLEMDASNLVVPGSWSPGAPAGYLSVTIQGATRRIPYY